MEVWLQSKRKLVSDCKNEFCIYCSCCKLYIMYRIVYAAIFLFCKKKCKRIKSKFLLRSCFNPWKNEIFIMIFEHLTWPKSQFQAYTYVASVSKNDLWLWARTADIRFLRQISLHAPLCKIYHLTSVLSVLLSYFYRGNFLWVWKPSPVWNDI